MCLTFQILVILMTLVTVSNAEDPCHIAGIDVPGDDIETVSKDNLEQCRYACSAEPRFVYRYENRSSTLVYGC